VHSFGTIENLKMRDQQLKIREDFEREFLKDYVYLQEEEHEVNKQIQEEMNKLRKPAEIFIVDTDKILERHEIRHNILPF
jgi:hypothetical protein